MVNNREMRNRTRRREGYQREGSAPPNYDAEDQGYEQEEERYQEGDDGSIEEAYLLDPDEGFTAEDLLFAENAFSPSMWGSPVPKDGLEKPDVPAGEMEDDAATSDPYEAIDSGEVYYPPEDPPTLPSRGLQDVEIASGFATSADDAPLEDYDTPVRFVDRDLDIAERVQSALRLHAYTSDLAIRLQVHDGIVTLRGRVQTLQDIAEVEDVVSEVEGVQAIREQLSLT